MNKKLLYILIVSIFMCFVSTKAFAETTSEPGQIPTTNPKLDSLKRRIDSTKDKLEKVKENVKENLKENFCEATTTRIDTKINAYETIKSDEYPRITRIISTLKSISATQKSKGIDTSKLDKDIATLESKASNSKTLYETFISKLKETKSYNCGSSQGQFVTALKAAKIAHQSSIASIRETRQFIRLTIIGDLRAIKGKTKQPVTPTSVPVVSTTN